MPWCGGGRRHGASLHGRVAGSGAAGVRTGRAEPGLARGPVRGRGEHALPLAAGVAERGAAGGEAACRGSSASPGREGLGHAQGTRGRAQRPDVGRVRAGTRQACRGEGEPAYLVPGAQEAGSAAQKRAGARRSRTGPSSPRRGTTGGPSWPRWTPSASSSLTRAGSTPGWPGLTPVPLQVSAPWARCRGQGAVGKVPWGHWKRLTVLGALALDGVVAGMSIAAATGTAVFLAFVEQVLIPTLLQRPDAIVVMDNLAAHKAKAVQRALDRAGINYRYLPPYSPDLNPIEQAWSKLKAHLRTKAARSLEALEVELGPALDAITANDAQGWFRLAGYAAPN